MSMWQPVGALAIGAVILALLFAFHLGRLMPGISAPELQTRVSSQSLHKILDDPVNTPYKTGEYLIRKVHSTVAFERVISGFIAGFSVILFYILARHFTSRFSATLGTLMFATSSALLHNGRLATPGITLLFLLFLLACGYRLRFNSHRSRTWFLTAGALGLALYTPGMIYFVIAGAIWQYRAVKRSYELPDLKDSLISGAILLVILLPLILGIIHHPVLWREYLLVPKIFPHIKNFFLQLLAVPAGVVAFAPKNALYRLGRQPVLDAFAAAMFIVGLYTLIKRYKLDRLILFGGIFALGSVLTAFSGNYEYSFILVPFIYLTIAIGIGVLFEVWRAVFPFNPLARSVAMVMIVLAVITSCNFQLRRYFVAWPHNEAAKAVFVLK